jgi:hypothetical protein
MGGNDLQDFEDLEEDVTNLGDDCTQPFLTKEDYEKSLNTQQPSNKYENINNTDVSGYQEITDSIMAEVQPRYNMRSKNKPALTPQPKKFSLEVKYTSPP